MRKNLTSFFAVILSIALVACNSNSSTNTENSTSTDATATSNELEIKKFLIDTEGFYGWETSADQISLDFFEDGRLHIQGPDGEASMWEGSWTIKGDQLTLVRADLGKTETVTVQMKGAQLILGDKIYTRYKPA